MSRPNAAATNPEFSVIEDDEEGFNVPAWYLVCHEERYEHTHQHGGHAFRITPDLMRQLIINLEAALVKAR